MNKKIFVMLIFLLSGCSFLNHDKILQDKFDDCIIKSCILEDTIEIQSNLINELKEQNRILMEALQEKK